jgi:hypothetical protein
MREKHPRVRCELTAILNGRLERALMSAELRPNGRKNLLASDPRYHPSKESGNNAQNDSYHRFLLFISLQCLHQESARNRLGPLSQTHASDRPYPAVVTLLQLYLSGCPKAQRYSILPIRIARNSHITALYA